MRIDAHQHFWALARGDYHWLTQDLAPINVDHMPDDLVPLLDMAGIDASIVVQAAETFEETLFLLDLIKDNPRIAGVVGWVDLTSSSCGTQLRALKALPKLKGIRPVLQDMDDTLFILRPEVISNIGLAHSLGFTFDALIRPRHLPAITALADRFPALPIVVDHAAKPFIADGVLQPWADDMRALARRQNVHCKVSGLVTEAVPHWTVAELRPYLDHLKDVFGAERLMFGSDWPVCKLAAPYPVWVAAAQELTQHWTRDELDHVFGGTAARFYGIGDLT